MDPIILDDIPFTITFDHLSQATRVRKGSRHADTLKGLLRKAQEIARPKAML